MRLVIVSDTHGMQDQMSFPEGDVLLHCGDFCMGGGPKELTQMLTWFDKLEYRHKICIAGNHDIHAEGNTPFVRDALKEFNSHYLFESGITIDGIKFWGSPIQPEFHDWAFNRTKQFRSTYWREKLPDDVDVLLTHSPPKNILDVNHMGWNVGCKHLAMGVQLVRPLLHCFGHIHESRGIVAYDGVSYVNASMVDFGMAPIHNAWVLDIDPPIVSLESF